MSSFTVEQVLSSREWAPKDNPSNKVIYYDLKLQGRDGKVSVGHKPGGIVPTPGFVYDGYAIDEEKGKLVKLKSAFGGGGRGPKDPAERRSIAMQTAIKSATDDVRLGMEAGVFKPDSIKQIAEARVSVAKVLYRTIIDAEKETT